MGYLGMKSDLAASVLLTQLGKVNDKNAMSEPLGHSRDTVGAVCLSHDKTGRHVVSEVYSPPRIALEIKKGR